MDCLETELASTKSWCISERNTPPKDKLKTGIPSQQRRETSQRSNGEQVDVGISLSQYMRTQTDSLTDSPTNSPNVRIIGDHKIINNDIAKSAQQLFVFVGPFYKIPPKYSNDDRYQNW